MHILRDSVDFPLLVRVMRTTATLLRDFGFSIVNEVSPVLHLIFHYLAAAANRSSYGGVSWGQPPLSSHHLSPTPAVPVLAYTITLAHTLTLTLKVDPDPPLVVT